VYNIYIS